MVILTVEFVLLPMPLARTNQTSSNTSGSEVAFTMSANYRAGDRGAGGGEIRHTLMYLSVETTP